jgi:hypothetical protein
MILSDPALLNKNIQTTSSVHKVIKKIKKVWYNIFTKGVKIWK